MGRWAGLMAFTADYLPVADRAPGLPGVWVAGGFCGRGMPFGMRLGQLLAEAATTGAIPAELELLEERSFSTTSSAATTGARPAGLEPLRIDRPTLTRR